MSDPQARVGSVGGDPQDARNQHGWVGASALLVAVVVVPAGLALLQAVEFQRGEAIGWLAIGPLLASLALPWRRVAAVAAYTLLIGVALVVAHPGPSTGVDLVRLSVVAALGGFAVLNCQIRERREARLGQVSEVARVAQAAIVQPVPTRAGRWELASRYRSSAASAEVGGDLLEVLPTAAGARMIIGDVSGKGLLAVRLAATALTSFREACTQQELPLPEVARRVDHSVLQRSGEEEFVTAILADFDDRGWLHMVNSGHPPPLRLTASGELQPLSPKVATSPLTLSPSLRSDTYCITPGDRVLLYTDGLLEARNPAGDFFPLHEQVALLAGEDLQAVLDGLLAAVKRHVGGRLNDDIALLLATIPPDRH